MMMMVHKTNKHTWATEFNKRLTFISLYFSLFDSFTLSFELLFNERTLFDLCFVRLFIQHHMCNIASARTHVCIFVYGTDLIVSTFFFSSQHTTNYYTASLSHLFFRHQNECTARVNEKRVHTIRKPVILTLF